MKSFAIAIAMVMLVLAAPGRASTEAAAPAMAARTLNAQSKTALHVSVRALAYLFDARPGSYLLRDAIVQRDRAELKALEEAGLVRVTRVGQDDKYLQIGRTSSGEKVADELYGS